MAVYVLECRKTELNAVELYYQSPTEDMLLLGQTGNFYKELTQQKNRLEFYMLSGLSHLYKQVRDELYPKKTKLSRAGEKIRDIFREFPQLQKATTFLDVCGAPGAWSEYLLSMGMKGITISIESTDKNFQYYTTLLENKNIKCQYADVTSALEFSTTFDIIVADGAPSEKEYENENLQELYAARILLSEAVLIKHLNDNGNFVMKIFDTFSMFTKSLLYCICQCFDKKYIFKPVNSRMINSEKYLVCTGKKKGSKVLDILENVKALWNTIPMTIIPQHSMQSDTKFNVSFSNYMKHYTDMQVYALRKIADRLDNLTSGNAQVKGQGKGFKGQGKGFKGHGKGQGLSRSSPYQLKGVQI